MKIRQGFVSNSSSSSFIVPFPKDMEMTVSNIHKYLYGDTPFSIYYYESSVSSMEAAQIIHDEIHKQTSNDKKRLYDAMDGWIPGQPEWDYSNNPLLPANHEEWNKQWRKYEKRLERYRNGLLNEYTHKWGDNVDLYTFVFSDEDGLPWVVLEYGPTFDNVPHLAISHH